MSDNFSCIVFFDGYGYRREWMNGDKVLFSDIARDAFHLVDSDYKFLAELQSSSDDLISTEAVLENVSKSPAYFCSPNKIDELLRALLVILNTHGAPSGIHNTSYADRLSNYQKSVSYKITLAETKKKSEELRLQRLVRNIEEIVDVVENEPNVLRLMKRKRRDLGPIVDSFESLINPKIPQHHPTNY